MVDGTDHILHLTLGDTGEGQLGDELGQGMELLLGGLTDTRHRIRSDEGTASRRRDDDSPADELGVAFLYGIGVNTQGNR